MNHRSIIFSKYLSDEAMVTIVSDEAFINKMLQFEAALAKAQATLDMIPNQSAEKVVNALNKISFFVCTCSLPSETCERILGY